MGCCINELCDKDVINVKDGRRLGCVSDVEIDVCSGRLIAIIISGECKGFLFGKCEKIRIPWDRIVRIGDDAILVDIPCDNVPCECNKPPKKPIC